MAASAAAAKCGMKFKAAIKFGKDNFKCIAWPAAYERPVQSSSQEILRKSPLSPPNPVPAIVMRLCVKQIINQ